MNELPIYLPKFEPEHWQQIEKQLLAIAAKEKACLEPRDRLVNNSLFLAQSYAKSKDWNALFNYLSVRNIIAIGAIAPPQKLPTVRSPKKPNTSSLKEKEISKKKQLQELLSQVILLNELTSLATVQGKLLKIGFEITDHTCREYLYQFFKLGLIFSCHSYGTRNAWYSLNESKRIHVDESFTSTYALKIARENGYEGTDAYFIQYPYERADANLKPFDFYAQFNIEYTKAIAEDPKTSYYKFKILNR